MGKQKVLDTLLENITDPADLSIYAALRQRRVPLHGEVTEEGVAKIIETFETLRYLDAKKPMTLQVISGGGDADAALALIEYMRTIRTPVQTEAIGYAQSAATYIVTCGTKGLRSATRNSRFLFHTAATDPGERKAHDHETYQKEVDVVLSIIARRIASQSAVPYKEVKALVHSLPDLYMGASEMKRRGLIDRIF